MSDEPWSECGTCGMTVHRNCPEPHVCPEPLSYDVARSLCGLYSSPGAPPIHPRDAAAIRMGLGEVPRRPSATQIVRAGLLGERLGVRVVLDPMQPRGMYRLGYPAAPARADDSPFQVPSGGPRP